MVVILVHNAQTGQMQYITEGCDQQQGCALMQQAIAMIQQQTGGLSVPAVNGAPPSPPSQPPPPRPRNIREVITPKGQE